MKPLKEALFSRKNIGTSNIDKILVANCSNAIDPDQGKFEKYLGTPLQDLYSIDKLYNEIRKRDIKIETDDYTFRFYYNDKRDEIFDWIIRLYYDKILRKYNISENPDVIIEEVVNKDVNRFYFIWLK